MNNIIVLLAVGAVAIPLAAYLFLVLVEKILSILPGRADALRPWLWLLPPAVLIASILIVPTVLTLHYSLRNYDASQWAGLDNVIWAFSDNMMPVLANNALWLVVFPLVTVILALVVAVLFDRVKYEKLARTIVVLPTAISFTAGAIIWRSLYQYSPPGRPQPGLFNAIWTSTGRKPVPWLQDERINTYALIMVAVWMSLGVATLILSAAVKNVPRELTEAAKVDGAGELRCFWKITVPMLWPTLLVVLTTEIIFCLKVFDIVYVMTNGNFGTDVIARKMYYELFSVNDLGRASAMAVVLLVAAIPVIWLNLRSARTETEVH